MINFENRKHAALHLKLVLICKRLIQVDQIRQNRQVDQVWNLETIMHKYRLIVEDFAYALVIALDCVNRAERSVKGLTSPVKIFRHVAKIQDLRICQITNISKDFFKNDEGRLLTINDSKDLSVEALEDFYGETQQWVHAFNPYKKIPLSLRSDAESKIALYSSIMSMLQSHAVVISDFNHHCIMDRFDFEGMQVGIKDPNFDAQTH